MNYNTSRPISTEATPCSSRLMMFSVTIAYTSIGPQPIKFPSHYVFLLITQVMAIPC
jgi:hypothetical protein